MDLLLEMVEHAREESPNEACGLVVASGKKHRTIRAKNVAADPWNTFEVDSDAWLAVEEHEEVIGIYHSHPRGTAQPSQADLVGIEASGLPWHIVNLDGSHTCTHPSGFQAPYLKRAYLHGVLDCYALIRDWFNREWNLGLPDFERDDSWWEKGGNLYVDNYEQCGFVRLVDQTPKTGDIFLIQLNSKVPNHAAIYVGDGNILHHCYHRLSSREVYGGMWQKCTTHHLRHISRMSNG